ncbi:MAG: InlB B-repeat-containing protein [Spirochaetia bacterium]|nr:InlB B-repeat-containing protein [Spirochaetia bacterium]
MKKITKLLLICFSIALFFSCQQVLDEKTYYLNTYTVEFDANGGSGTMKSQTFSQNKEQQLSKNAFEAPYGSQFVGWSTEPNAFSDEIEYTDNQSITVKENMTLYAVWKMVEGRGTETETKKFQFVFDDWQTTDTSVKPGDDFYEYSAGQFYELDEEEQSKKSLSSKLDLQISNFNSAQLNEPSFKIGQKYKELVIKDDDEFETVLDFLQEDIDKIKEVSTVSEFYELFAEYMWNDESYAYFTANFNGREPCVIIHIPGKEKITEFDLSLVDEYYDKDKASEFYQALKNKDLITGISEYKTDENSAYSIFKKSIINETGITDFDLLVSDRGEEFLKHIDLVCETADANPLLISLSLDYAKEFLCFLTAKKVYDNFNIEFIDFNKTPFYCSLLKAYQTEIDNDGKRKEYTKNLCKDLLDTFKKRIEKNTWMSGTTKAKAKEKAEKMIFLAGYPDDYLEEFLFENEAEKEWECAYRFISNLTKESRIMLIKRIFRNDLSIEQRLLDCYTLSENTIVNNAYYDPSNNTMVINIPNLQEEVLKLDSSAAFNYAVLGATTIGHELCHAIDSSGAQYGPDGKRLEWWTISDKLRYKEKQNQMKSLYNQFVISSDGSSVSGERTLDENLADLGGFTVAYDTFLSQKIDELTDEEFIEQRKVFFQSFAIYWAIPDKGDWENDVHSPYEFRIRGVVCNMDDWYNLYNVKFGDTYYLSPDQRIILW